MPHPLLYEKLKLCHFYLKTVYETFKLFRLKWIYIYMCDTFLGIGNTCILWDIQARKTLVTLVVLELTDLMRGGGKMSQVELRAFLGNPVYLFMELTLTVVWI